MGKLMTTYHWPLKAGTIIDEQKANIKIRVPAVVSQFDREGRDFGSATVAGAGGAKPDRLARRTRPNSGMRRLDLLFTAWIASIKLADAEIKAYNVRIMCVE